MALTSHQQRLHCSVVRLAHSLAQTSCCKCSVYDWMDHVWPWLNACVCACGAGASTCKGTPLTGLASHGLAVTTPNQASKHELLASRNACASPHLHNCVMFPCVCVMLSCGQQQRHACDTKLTITLPPPSSHTAQGSSSAQPRTRHEYSNNIIFFIANAAGPARMACKGHHNTQGIKVARGSKGSRRQRTLLGQRRRMQTAMQLV